MNRLFLAPLLLLPLTDLSAQEALAIEPGARVRIEMPPKPDSLRALATEWGYGGGARAPRFIVGSVVSLEADASRA